MKNQLSNMEAASLGFNLSCRLPNMSIEAAEKAIREYIDVTRDLFKKERDINEKTP